MQLRAARTWFGTARNGDQPHGGVERDLLFANPRRAPQDKLERFVLGYLTTHGPVSRGTLAGSVQEWLAGQERTLAAGSGDLGVWDTSLWRDEAWRAVARLEGELIDGGT